MALLYESEPSKLEEARKLFVELPDPVYTNKQLGLSNQLEIMACDCVDDCSDSNCINRLTYMECYSTVCVCPEDCGNRRFQLHQMAQMDVFDAGEKGFGVRALEPLKKGDFIGEYTGEVVNKTRLAQRQQKYTTKQHLKHFYFMMLQQDEYIDATEKGAITRYCNHSCDPNAEIEKWIVGPKVRLGLFAKRDIEKYEEICFDYKVDRFGGDAQPCYCKSANCSGFLGGRSQTGGPVLPPAALNGLGIDKDFALEWPEKVLNELYTEFPKESKTVISRYSTKKTKAASQHALITILQTGEDVLKDDEQTLKIRSFILDSLPITPVQREELPQIMRILMQLKSENAWIVTLILKRILLTPSNEAHARVLNMHGYEIMAYVLSEFKSSSEVVGLSLQLLQHWPHVTRNKISSSQIEQVVQQLKNSETLPQNLLTEASNLLAEWKELAMGYRIPRRKLPDDASNASNALNASNPSSSASDFSQPIHSENPYSSPGSAPVNPQFMIPVVPQPVNQIQLPPEYEMRTGDDGSVYYYNRNNHTATREFPITRPRSSTPSHAFNGPSIERQRLAELKKERDIKNAELQRIIDESVNSIHTAPAPELPPSQGTPTKSETRSSTMSPVPVKKTAPPSIEVQPSDVRTVMAKYVPKLVFVHEPVLGHDRCKRYSKEIVNTLAKKEESKIASKHGSKHPSFELTAEKKNKIKVFVKTYMEKVLMHYKKRESSLQIDAKKQKV